MQKCTQANKIFVKAGIDSALIGVRKPTVSKDKMFSLVFVLLKFHCVNRFQVISPTI